MSYRQEEYDAFMKKCSNKISPNGDLIYRLLALGVCKRFKIELDILFEPPRVVYAIVNYYVENIDMDFEKWLHQNDAPLIREATELKRIFPEIASFEKNNAKIVEIANEIYGLNLKLYSEKYETEYIYSYSFDFNSFVPIDMKRIKELKEEMKFCEKYNLDTTKLKEEILSFGLKEEQIELI